MLCSDCFGPDGADLEEESDDELDPNSAIALLQAASAAERANGD
jgi:hypothetical protein